MAEKRPHWRSSNLRGGQQQQGGGSGGPSEGAAVAEGEASELEELRARVLDLQARSRPGAVLLCE